MLILDIGVASKLVTRRIAVLGGPPTEFLKFWHGPVAKEGKM